MAEQERSDRPRNERDAKRDERGQRLRRRGAVWKEHRADHERRGGRVHIEIIEFDRGADKAGEDDSRGVARPVHRRAG
jgi:hypothetical protein